MRVGKKVLAETSVGATAVRRTSRPFLSVVTCTHNESENLSGLYEPLWDVLDELRLERERIVLDDHSRNATFDVMAGIAAKDLWVRYLGRSGWSLKNKVKLVADWVTSFRDFPIRIMSYLGFLTAFAGFAYALVVIANAVKGHLVQGWSSLMGEVRVFSVVQMLMIGVLSEYLWRALDEVRRRPRYLIEAAVDSRGAEALAVPNPK